jgi:hypothetical protein
MPKKPEFAAELLRKTAFRNVQILRIIKIEVRFSQPPANEGLGIFIKAEVFFATFFFKKKVEISY